MNEVEVLTQEVRALRAELDELRSRTLPAEAPVAPARAPSSRREVLRRTAAMAGAAAAGVALFPGRTMAANGDPLAVGQITTATATTELKLPGFPNTPSSIFSHVLAVQDGVWSTPRIPGANAAPEAGTSAGVAGLVGGLVMHGGYFQTNNPTLGSSGVRARGEVAGSYGVWAAGRRAAIRLERLPLQIPPSDRADSHNEGEILIDDNSDLWYCVVPGSPGRWLKLAGPSASGQLHAITPARVYDSRYTGAVDAGVGPILQGLSRTVSVATAYQANSATPSINDVVPAGATAIAYNLTIVNSGASGFLSVNPGGTPAITASSINWTAPGTILANAAIVALDTSRQIKVFCAGTPTDFIVDVTGYYR
jgi:hypothetical protein